MVRKVQKLHVLPVCEAVARIDDELQGALAVIREANERLGWVSGNSDGPAAELRELQRRLAMLARDALRHSVELDTAVRHAEHVARDKGFPRSVPLSLNASATAQKVWADASDSLPGAGVGDPSDAPPAPVKR